VTVKSKPERRLIAGGELLAIDGRALMKAPGAFFWLFGPSSPPVKRIGSTAIVYVRGPLEHHADCWGANYEQIIADVKCAWDGDEENEPCKKVVLAIDSPGGVVSGLYETVESLQKLASGRPFHAYVEGLCASAAMALACSCSKIFASRSSIMGSVGVIATMYSQRKRDKAMGIDVLTITSGARKDDGHPHVAISTDAIRAEQKRVAKFADAFFAIVEDARDFDPEPHEAGLFVGDDAVKAGYADGIASLDEFIASLEKTENGVSQEKKFTTGVNSDTMSKKETLMRFKALIKSTKKAIAGAKSEEEKARLRMDLAALQRSAALSAGSKKTTYEKETSEETDDDEEEASGEGEGGGSEEGDAESEEEDADAESEEEDVDAESDVDESDAESEDDEKKAIASAKKLKGKAGKAILSALIKASGARKAMKAELGGVRTLAKQVEKLRAENTKRDLAIVIDSALSAGRITPGEAKQLRKQSADHVGAFLSARPKAIVRKESLSPDIKQSASLVSQSMHNFAPSQVTAEITNEMREGAERMAQLAGGKFKAEDFLKEFQAAVTPKEHH
jgi:ClpP class serine protease